MFNGIVIGQGRVLSVKQHRAGDYQLLIQAPETMPKLQCGDSVAVQGVCLSIVELPKPYCLAFDVSNTTAQNTTLAHLATDDLVNLEPALQLGDRINGHLLSGHVDGVAK